jgi:hypothetical protein
MLGPTERWETRTLWRTVAGPPLAHPGILVWISARLGSAEQQMLAAASVAGIEFSSTLVAALLSEDIETIETSYDTLVRQGRFLQSTGVSEWPGGRIAACYRFVHAFYRDVFYRRLGANQRVRLHEQVAQQLEVLYGPQINDIASEVALHFERGRNDQRAVHYHQQAGEHALAGEGAAGMRGSSSTQRSSGTWRGVDMATYYQLCGFADTLLRRRTGL